MRVAAIEVGCLQSLASGQTIAEVEAVWASCHAYLLNLTLPDADLPGPAPPQRTEPDVAAVLIVRAVPVDRKPRVVLGTRGSAAAFENCLSGFDRLLVQAPLSGPSTG